MAIDVIDCQVGLAVHDQERNVAIRFFSPDGETIEFALPAEVAMKLATAMLIQLKMFDAADGSAKRH